MLKSAACESIWLTLEDDSVQFWTGFWCSLGNNQPVPRRCRRRTNAGALKPSGVSTARGSRGLAIGSLAIKSGLGVGGGFFKKNAQTQTPPFCPTPQWKPPPPPPSLIWRGHVLKPLTSFFLISPSASEK